jgi:acetyl esterase
MTLDQATSQFVAAAAQPGSVPIHELPVESARAFGTRLIPMYGSGPELESVEQLDLKAADGGSFAIRCLRPADTRGVIVYLHGGGWVVGGGLDSNDTMARILASATRCTVVLVDYRLAPEHPFPIPLRDASFATAWAAENLARLAASGAPLVVAGDSAGGNLAIGVGRLARDGGPEISQLVLAYPVADADFERPSYNAPENQLLLDRRGMEWFWDNYLPDPASRMDPDASPVRDPDLAGVPPTVILTAEHDPLRDEGEELAERLADAGVEVELRRFDGQMHGFLTMVNILPGSAEGLGFIADRINAALELRRPDRQ